MLYGGQPVKNLTVTKLLFWNAGRETITGADVARADPLGIHVSDCEILDAKILRAKNPVNCFKLDWAGDPSFAELRFDYVDRDEGVVIQVLHTAKTGRDVRLVGTVMGVGAPRRRFVVPERFRRRLWSPVAAASGLTAIALVASAIVAGVLELRAARDQFAEPPVELPLHPWFGFAFLLLLLLLLVTDRARAIRHRPPAGFEEFDQEW
jgi:hypothetical protein